MPFKLKSIVCLAWLAIALFSCQNEALKNAENNLSKADSSDATKMLAWLNSKVQKEPQNHQHYYDRAKFYLNHNQVALGIEDAQKAISLYPSGTESYILLADLYFSIVQTRQAKETLEKCLVVDPKNKDANLKLAELYLYVKQYKQSISYVDEVLKVNVRNPKAYFIKGMNFKFMGDTSKAISSFQTVVEQDPQYYNAYMQLGLIFAAKKNNLAGQYYNSAIKLDPSSTEAIYARAMLSQVNGLNDSAVNDYNRISSIQPDYKEAYYNKAFVLCYAKKQYKDASIAIDQYLKLAPNDERGLRLKEYCERGSK